MKKRLTCVVKQAALCAAVLLFAACGATDGNRTEIAIGTGNPYLPLWEHLPDGEPRVFEDPDNPGKYRAYIIGSHDLRFTEYCGPDIRMWSAPVEDLTDWRDEGAIFTYQTGGRWDVMYAPDLVEIKQKDGTKEYYLYPHSRGFGREAMVCKGSRPDGPFTPVNLTEDGKRTVAGSILGFDPSIFVEYITDPKDPDYNIGFRAYGFWGFQRSSAAQLDQNTMYSVRPGTKVIPYFIPASSPRGEVRDPKGTTYPALYKEQNPKDFNFFEASSIRQVGNKYVMIFSGYSGPDYGLGNSNSTLRYAFGDTPLGPWRSGGVLVDSRGIVLNQDGSKLEETNAAHNTHGSLEEINGQWYVFYHRPPRGFGFARQAMVAPVIIRWDEKAVAAGGKVTISGYDPFASDSIWQAKASNGNVYTGAEVTSEGFQIFGLDPYKYYSAGYACYLSNGRAMQDSWDIWDNNMAVDMLNGDIVGYKYFGFGGLDTPQKGLKPFAGTKEGNGTSFNLFLTAATDASFKINVWLDGPWSNEAWKGQKIGEIVVPAGAANKVTKYTIDVSEVVDRLDKKHALFLVAEGSGDTKLCALNGLGFSVKGKALEYPEVPEVEIKIGGKKVELPITPVRSTNANGYVGYDQYYAEYTLPANATKVPKVSASANDSRVKIDVVQPESKTGKSVVTFDYNGVVKTYTVQLKEQ
ncbi:MAG: hypothetical protein LBL97_01530 [Prevotellaceae bacterium]|jgi:hypothetical protein|nr:hypothetical protein [Prevotellaceae bacterium]